MTYQFMATSVSEELGEWWRGKIRELHHTSAMNSCFQKGSVESLGQPEQLWVSLHEASLQGDTMWAPGCSLGPAQSQSYLGHMYRTFWAAEMVSCIWNGLWVCPAPRCGCPSLLLSSVTARRRLCPDPLPGEKPRGAALGGTSLPQTNSRKERENRCPKQALGTQDSSFVQLILHMSTSSKRSKL